LPKEISTRSDILTKDVIQGNLGDSYLISALSCMAEFPNRIKNFFPQLNVSEKGCFSCVVFLHGVPVNIVIDDYFPFLETEKNEENKIAFAGMNNQTKNIWPMILEKVWAKINLNYENIKSGNVSEAFEFLTPAPFLTIDHCTFPTERLFQKIRLASQNKYIICCDNSLNLSNENNSQIDAKLRNSGLLTSHAYSLLSCAEVHELDGTVIQLFNIRNIWGTHEWHGDWSYSSKKWTPEIKKMLNYVDNKKDGNFWICFEDYVRFYTNTHICMFKDEYVFLYERFTYKHEKLFNIVAITFKNTGKAFIILNQKNSRIYKNNKGLNNYNNRFCSMIVGKIMPDDTLCFVGAKCGDYNRLFIETDVTPGIYYVIVNFPMNSNDFIKDYNTFIKHTSINLENETTTFNIGVYSTFSNVDIKEARIKNPKDIMYKLMTSQALSFPDNKYYFVEENESKTWRNSRLDDEDGAYGFIYYDNQSEGYIHEKMTFTKLENVNLIPFLDENGFQSLDLSKNAREKLLEFELDIIKSTENQKLPSSVIVLENERNSYKNKGSQEISEDKTLEVDIIIAPNTQGILLFEKGNKQSSIEFESKVAITYPINVLLKDNKYSQNVKKNKLQYYDEKIDITEYIIEHRCGVIIKYKNKTKLFLKVYLNFTKLVNLKLLKSKLDFSKAVAEKGDLIIDNNTDYAILETVENVDVDDPINEAVLIINPGEVDFIVLLADNLYKQFSYDCKMEYDIRKVKFNIQ